MSNLRMFLPITKVDAAQRLVYGIATGEALDRSGEVCDYETTKPFYEKWSGDIAKATGGKSFGNVRAMHGSIAAGKVASITFNDAAKQIEIAAKIVDDAEWRKVEEGVYTGFSQGGSYKKRWTDEATGHQRYTADPSEVSLVDLPCLPDATFQMVKAAGVIETKHFAKSVQVEVAPPSNADVNAKATEMAKAAGRETEVSAFFEPAREALVKAALPAPPEAKPVEDGATAEPAPTNVADGVEQVWKARDGSTHAKKADALAKNAELAAAPGTKAVLDALGELGGKLGIAKGDQGGDAPGNGTKKPGEGKDQADGDDATAMNEGSFTRKKKRIAPDGSTMKAATAESLAKDLYTASRFAELLASLRGMAQSAEYQAILSDDGDPEFAAKMKAWVGDGCALLVALVQSEADDLDPDTDDGAAMAMAAGATLKPGDVAALGKIAADVPKLAKAMPALEKAGARNSKADADKIQAMHDHACDLGATCKGGDASKAAGGADMVKALAEMTTGRDLEKARGDALQKTLDDQILPMLKAIGTKVDNIERQPMPLPLQNAGTRVVTKGAEGDDGGERPLADRLAEMREKDPDGYQLLMIKVAQQNPQQLSYAR